MSQIENLTQQNAALDLIYENATHIFKGAEINGNFASEKEHNRQNNEKNFNILLEETKKT